MKIEPGTRFSVVSGPYYSTNENEGFWSSSALSGGGFSNINVIYTGDVSIEEGTNFCIFINESSNNLGDGFDVSGLIPSISLNGIDRTSDFIFNSGGDGNSLNIDFNTDNTFYITQGKFLLKGGNYYLSGSVLDGIKIGNYKEYPIPEGIPQSLGSDISDVNVPEFNGGSYYGILVCDGEIYICDITEYILNTENWTIFSGEMDEVDLQAICDELCGYMNDCEGELSITVNDCTLSLESELPCEEATYYKWKHYSSPEWVILDEGPVIANTIPQYLSSVNGLYLLEVECADGCSYSSQPPIFVHNCEECIAEVNIYQNGCTLVSTLTNCSGNPEYQWYVWENNQWVLITGANNPNYQPSEPGLYQVRIVGCENCSENIAEYLYEDEAEVFLVEEIIETESYEICPQCNIIEDIIVNGIHLNELTDFFTFPYYGYNSSPSWQDLINHLNVWLLSIGDPGEAFLWGDKIVCFQVRCTELEFQILIMDCEESSQNWNIIDYPCYEQIRALHASVPCTPISYLWSTGETTETIEYTGGYYSVTVTCENGCTYTGHYGLNPNPIVYHNTENGNGNSSSLLNKQKIDLKAYPIPAKDEINFIANVDRDGTYNLIIYNMMGDNVMTFKAKLDKGITNLPPVKLDIPPGVYIIILSDDRSKVSKKIVIAK